MIIAGCREATVTGSDDEARDESRDGNACHIDEASQREVRNEISYFLLPVSRCLSWGLWGQFFTAIIYLVFFSLFSRLFSLSNLPVFLLDYSFLCPSFDSGHYSSLTPGYVSLVSYSFPTLYNSQLCSNLFLAKEMKVPTYPRLL